MSVKLVDNAAFYGYLARRSCDGETQREYFSLVQIAEGDKKGVRLKIGSKAAKLVKAEADAKDKEFADWQTAKKQKLVAKARPTARNNTGVRGIWYGPVVSMKRGVRYERFGFTVGCKTSEGKRINKPFVFDPVTADDKAIKKVWTSACKCLAQAQGIALAPLVKRMPDMTTLIEA